MATRKTASTNLKTNKKTRRLSSNFSQRAKSSVFIILYFAILVFLAIFADPKCRVIPKFQENLFIPLGFFIAIFAFTI